MRHLATRRSSALAAATALLVLVSACASAPPVTPTPSSTATPSPLPTASPTASPTATPTPSPTPSPTPVPTPTPIPLDAALLGRRITVLVIGTDETAARTASGMAVHNTDSMLVASINAAHDRIGIVALPRDTVDLPLGDGTTFHGKANSIRWHYGISGLRNALSTTYGIPIDFTIEIDMEDFGRLVDAVGGVNVTVYKRIYDAHIRFVLNPGTHHLDGGSATKYVRSRYSAGGDYGRGWRQMQMLMALVRKAADPATRVDLLALARSLGSLKTDIPLDKLATFLEIIRRSQHADVLAQMLQPPHFALFEGIAGPRGWVMIPNIPAMRRLVRSIMTG